MNSPLHWREALSEKTLRLLELEEIRGTDGKISGWRLVLPNKNDSNHTTNMIFAHDSPPLHARHSDISLAGRSFVSGDDDPKKRYCTIKCTKNFEMNNEYVEKHPEILEHNESFYHGMNCLLERVKEMLVSDKEIQFRYLRGVICQEEEGVTALIGFLQLNPRLLEDVLVATLKDDVRLIDDAVTKMPEINRRTPDWRSLVARKIVQQRNIASCPTAVHKETILCLDRKREVRDKVIQEFVQVYDIRSNPCLTQLVRRGLDEEFGSWIFYGREGMPGDACPGDTLRVKYRPFHKMDDSSRQVASHSSSHTLDFEAATKVDIPRYVTIRAGLTEVSFFEMLQRANREGLTFRHPRFIGRFPPEPSHRLPTGDVVSWYEDPRVEVIQPGTVVGFPHISYFIYRNPQPGIRMVTAPRICVFNRTSPVFTDQTMTQNSEYFDDVTAPHQSSSSRAPGVKRKRHEEDGYDSSYLNIPPDIAESGLEGYFSTSNMP